MKPFTVVKLFLKNETPDIPLPVDIDDDKQSLPSSVSWRVVSNTTAKAPSTDQKPYTNCRLSSWKSQSAWTTHQCQTTVLLRCRHTSATSEIWIQIQATKPTLQRPPATYPPLSCHLIMRAWGIRHSGQHPNYEINSKVIPLPILFSKRSNKTPIHFWTWRFRSRKRQITASRHFWTGSVHLETLLWNSRLGICCTTHRQNCRQFRNWRVSGLHSNLEPLGLLVPLPLANSSWSTTCTSFRLSPCVRPP